MGFTLFKSAMSETVTHLSFVSQPSYQRYRLTSTLLLYARIIAAMKPHRTSCLPKNIIQNCQAKHQRNPPK